LGLIFSFLPGGLHENSVRNNVHISAAVWLSVFIKKLGQCALQKPSVFWSYLFSTSDMVTCVHNVIQQSLKSSLAVNKYYIHLLLDTRWMSVQMGEESKL
jgi:hypothetical protein